jgi:hypothetical protein
MCFMTKKNNIWIKAVGNADRSVTYHDKDGNSMTRHLDPKAKNPPRGTRSWRHHNPGNITHSDFSKRHGAIGFACYPNPYNPKKKLCFAIFPDYETGKKALATLLKTEKYIDLTLNQFPRRYTGILSDDVPDNGEVIEYRKDLRIISKLDMERKIRSLKVEEYEKFLDAIQRHEGWYPGDETFELTKEKVVGVKFLKHKATEFLVQSTSGTKKWITRTQAIALAEDKRLLAVVVHGRHGVYLRPFPHQPRFHDMIIR